MDFLDPKKKRSNKVKLYVGYLLVAIAISMAVAILLFANEGYRLDGRGNITQNSLLFVNSHPSGANVYIEGLHNKYKTQGKTDTKFDLREGAYRVTLEKDGYRSWQREMSLEGGAVERLAYPLLFPKKLVSSELKTYDQPPGIVSSSPDRKWIIVQQPVNQLMFDVFNANEPEKPSTSFAIPTNILSAPKNSQSFEVVEWSSDNSNILMKHNYDDKTEFVIINKDKPETSFNVNSLTNQQPFEVSLKDRKIDQMYLHMAPDGLLQMVDIKSRLLSPVVARAYAYKSHGDDMLIYVTDSQTKPGEVATVHIKTGDKDYELRDLPLGSKYVLDVARFDNTWYVVVGASGDNKVHVYKDPLLVLAAPRPLKSMNARTLRINNPSQVSFSANARMIAAQSGQDFVVFDAETDRQYRYSIADKFDSDRPAFWMDGHRLVSSTDNSVIIFDFDGINQQKLIPINNRTDAMFDRDYENIFTLAPAQTDGKSALVKTKLLVSN